MRRRRRRAAQEAKLRTKAISHVHRSGSALENAERLDNGRGHTVLGLVDAEVLEGSLGLGAPVLVGRDLDLAKGVALGTGRSHSEGGGAESSLLKG